MILNISHNKQEVCEGIRREVGKALSIFKRIRLGGSNSQKFVIAEASNKLKKLALLENKINFCNIELREQVIIFHFSPKSDTYVWVIPYYLLSIFKNATHVSLFAEGEFVRLTSENNPSLNYRFLQKLLDQKSRQHTIVDYYQ